MQEQEYFLKTFLSKFNTLRLFYRSLASFIVHTRGGGGCSWRQCPRGDGVRFTPVALSRRAFSSTMLSIGC
jgi:hypothetical protein